MASRVQLFIVCANPKCERVKPVRNAYDQRRYKHCSKRCAAVMTGAIRNQPTEKRREWARRSANERRRRAMARLAEMTPVQIYRAAFSAGWKAGARSVRRRLVTKGAGR